ncbi:hypothetical protein ACHAWF_005823 [Thalassiosira exigua]
MADSPTRKKRFGAGICWDYMDRGSCPCEASKFPAWHPRLSVAASTAAPSASATATVTVVSMPKRIPEWIESLKYLGFVEGDPQNFAILNTTYEEREEAKALGASFAPGMRKWIVVQGQDLAPFARWQPRIHNRGPNEVVLYHSSMDITSTVKELLHCGFHLAHFDIQGSDAEPETLRKEILAMKQGIRGLDNLGKDDGSNRARTNDAPGNFAKRPRFSTPESLQTFVRRGQDEQTKSTPRKARLSIEEDVGGHQDKDELNKLLSTAKSKLVLCNITGGISREQKQFNEAIYHVIESLVAKHNSTGRSDGKTDVHTNNLDPEHVNERRTMVTPTQKATGTTGKASGVPGTWYDRT